MFEAEAVLRGHAAAPGTRTCRYSRNGQEAVRRSPRRSLAQLMVVPFGPYFFANVCIDSGRLNSRVSSVLAGKCVSRRAIFADAKINVANVSINVSQSHSLRRERLCASVCVPQPLVQSARSCTEVARRGNGFEMALCPPAREGVRRRRMGDSGLGHVSRVGEGSSTFPRVASPGQ